MTRFSFKNASYCVGHYFVKLVLLQESLIFLHANRKKCIPTCTSLQSDQHLCSISGKYNTGAYPGFLDRGFIFTKGVGFKFT